MLALGQMLVILVRGIDLSIAANLALCGMLAALFNRACPGSRASRRCSRSRWSPARLLGACNGLLVWKLRLPPIVVTLGTMSDLSRRDLSCCPRAPGSMKTRCRAASSRFTRGEFLGHLRCSPGSRSRSSPRLHRGAAPYARARASCTRRAAIPRPPATPASTRAGCSSSRTRSAARSPGLCGYLWVARFAVAYTDIALGFELQVIAACLIGGVAIAGGDGHAPPVSCWAACSSASSAAVCRSSASPRSGRCSSTASSSWSRCC